MTIYDRGQIASPFTILYKREFGMYSFLNPSMSCTTHELPWLHLVTFLDKKQHIRKKTLENPLQSTLEQWKKIDFKDMHFWSLLKCLTFNTGHFVYLLICSNNLGVATKTEQCDECSCMSHGFANSWMSLMNVTFLFYHFGCSKQVECTFKI